jgi:hypothetical protein
MQIESMPCVHVRANLAPPPRGLTHASHTSHSISLSLFLSLFLSLSLSAHAEVLKPSLQAAFVDLDMTPPWWGAAAAREGEDVPWRLGAGTSEDGTSEDGVLCDEAAEEERGQSGGQGQGAEGQGESEEDGGGLSAWLQKQGIVHVVSSGRDAREGGRGGGRKGGGGGELGCES